MISFAKRYPYIVLGLLAVVSLVLYWGFLASDRYVSESNVVLESPQLAQPSLSFQTLLSGSGGSHSDMLLLRDYLLSVDMLRKVDSKLNLRKHYSSADIDIFSRLSQLNVAVEILHEYYLKRVSVELDSYAGVLRIRVEAFNSRMAQQIASELLREGERHMNEMGRRLAEEQVRFLEREVSKLRGHLGGTRKALLDYQNENGLVSPAGEVESLSAVVSSLESRLSDLKTRRATLLSFQSSRSPDVLALNRGIEAVSQQMRQERARMAAEAGGALNSISSEYQALELNAQFAQKSYSAALLALENTRIEAARKLKQVSVLQNPTLPEYSNEPRRIYNIAVTLVVALFMMLIAHMLSMIVKDHLD